MSKAINSKLTAALAASALIASLSMSAYAGQPLLPPGGSDQVPVHLSALPAPSGQFERAPVQFAWPLDPRVELSDPEPFRAESREFWQTVDATQLRHGFAVDLSAPGALIRISPVHGAKPMQAADLQLLGNGRAVTLAPMASAAQLRSAGMAVAAGTVVMQMTGDHGSGRYRLQSDTAEGRYLVHVLEPDSPIALHAQADRLHALAGDSIRLDVAMTGAGRDERAQAEALLVSPDGNSQPVRLQRSANGFGAKVRLPVDATDAPGLWELQVFASGHGVQRDARVAFAVTQPTARLSGDYTANRSGRSVQLPLQATSAGRYEVRATLYATGPDRVLRPVAQGHSAAWFEPGRGVLALDFGKLRLPDGYGAPFELRRLELQDQVRSSAIEVRARAVRF
ncbi:MAG TPA: DUF4785 domain-containing protein [Lysobacter sp.]